jgi:hypothetical protein
MSEKSVKRFQLCTENLKTLDDVIKIIDTLQVRIDTDNPNYEELKDYFTVEVVPPGYLKLYEKIGPDKIYKMTSEEIKKSCNEILQNEETN